MNSLPQPSDKEMFDFGEGLGSFMSGLALEGDRTLVIGGAARLDVTLERLLKKVMLHHPGGSDNLFDSDRPLGSFSAKNWLGSQAGAHYDEVEHALQMIRKIRNDSAHATSQVTLAESVHSNRVREIVTCVRKVTTFEKMQELLAEQVREKTNHKEIASLGSAISIIAAALQVATIKNGPARREHMARLEMMNE